MINFHQPFKSFSHYFSHIPNKLFRYKIQSFISQSKSSINNSFVHKIINPINKITSYIYLLVNVNSRSITIEFLKIILSFSIVRWIFFPPSPFIFWSFLSLFFLYKNLCVFKIDEIERKRRISMCTLKEFFFTRLRKIW